MSYKEWDHCPKCNSKDLRHPETSSMGASKGAGILIGAGIGALFGGPVGAAVGAGIGKWVGAGAGFINGVNAQDTYICNKCGHEFSKYK